MSETAAMNNNGPSQKKRKSLTMKEKWRTTFCQTCRVALTALCAVNATWWSSNKEKVVKKRRYTINFIYSKTIQYIYIYIYIQDARVPGSYIHREAEDGGGGRSGGREEE